MTLYSQRICLWCQSRRSKQQRLQHYNNGGGQQEWWWFCLILLLCSTIDPTKGLVVVHPPSLAGYYSTPVIHRFGLIEFPPLTGNVAVFPGVAEANLTGLIALIPAQGAPMGRGLEYKARLAKASGAIAIIAMSEVPSPISGFSDIVWNDCCPDDVKLPVVELSLFDAIAWLKSGEMNITVIINCTDFNPWRAISVKSLYSVYFGMVWCMVAFGLTLFALYKLYFTIHYRGISTKTAAFMFLVIEAVCNFERFIYYLLDPMFTRQYLSHLVISVLYTFTTPFTFICSLLITISWFQIQKKVKYLSKESLTLLGHTKVPFLIISVTLVILEIISSVMRGLMYDIGILIQAIWTAQGIIGIIFSVLYFVHGTKVLIVMDSFSQKEARETTQLLIFSGIFLLGFSVMLIIGASPVHFSSIGSWYSIQNLWMFFISFISGTQLAAIPIPTKKASKVTVELQGSSNG